MDYQLLNNCLKIAEYTTYAIWTVLLIILFTGVFKRNRILVKRTLKYLLNTIVFLIALIFYFELALIVKPAIYQTKEDSIKALELWIKNYQIKDIYVSLVTILILSSINLLLHFKVENKKYPKDIFILASFDTIILAIGIWATGQGAYLGLLGEINRHFG